ncbi:MAG: STAS domain-containing protein [Bacteroidales bacterium]|nr:STAS domain-containing protein [Candidatus Colimorpha onthohippi]
MKITEMNQDGTVTIKPEGWLDTASSPELGERVEAITDANAIVLDFKMVEYMSSSGLRCVLAAHNKAKSLGATFSVVNVCPTVMNIFKMTNIDKKLDIRLSV